MAKILLLILVVLGVLWFARAGRGRVAPPTPRAPDVPLHEAMVSCAHCGLHLPSSEALPGRGGVFCGEAHRAAYERAHPPQ
jgi:uncharacterized protein